MCTKNNTSYVAWTSNNRVIMACELYCCLLPQCDALRTCSSGFPIAKKWCCDQDMKVVLCETYAKRTCDRCGSLWKVDTVATTPHWRCAECVFYHERNVGEEQHLIYVARTSNNRVTMTCELYCYLLPQCEPLRTCKLGFSDSNKMVLWPGYEGHAVWSLHKKNVLSMRFVVKRRGCCYNHSAGIALNARFTMNGMCVKSNTTYMWREQAIIDWSWHVHSIVACCHSAKLCAHAARAFRSQQYLLHQCNCQANSNGLTSIHGWGQTWFSFIFTYIFCWHNRSSYCQTD